MLLLFETLSLFSFSRAKRKAKTNVRVGNESMINRVTIVYVCTGV